MTSDILLLQLLMSFIVGGLAIALATTIAERFGQKIGAVILSVPTTVVVALLFMGIVNSAEFVVSVIPFSIMGLTIFIIFLALFILLAKKIGGNALFLVVITWFILGFLAIMFPVSDLGTALLFFFVAYIPANLYFNRKKIITLKEKPATTKEIFLYRVIFAGFIVSFAVFLSKTLGAVWGGLFAIFPASTVSSYLILLRDYKKEFVISIAMEMIPFSIIFLFYVLSIYFLYPILGLYLGTAVCWLLSFIFAYILYRFIK